MCYFVSVIIPVYNGERYLAEAIASVLDQNYAPLEIIIVDDGSTDGTARVVAGAVAQFGECIRYVHQTRHGPAAARNRGLAQARGEVIAFLDHDDLWALNFLHRHIAYLVAHPDIEIVQGWIVQMERVPVELKPGEFTFEVSSEPYHFISLATAMYRKSVFERVGGFAEQMWEAEDTDWFLRAWEKNVAKVVLEDVVLYARRHETNLTDGTGQRLLPRLFKMHLDRLRAASEETEMPALYPTHAHLAAYLGLPPRRRTTRYKRTV